MRGRDEKHGSSSSDARVYVGQVMEVNIEGSAMVAGLARRKTALAKH